MKYSWGLEEGITIFGTEKAAKKYYILAGTQQKMDPQASAMLISDPVQCQEGDAYLSFRYWTSPKTSIRVCIRNTTTIKQFDWCSSIITKGDPGPAEVLIPGSIMYDFEIVIEARNFSYDAFGFQGGVVIIDDIKYNATTVYNCRNIPHKDPPTPLVEKTCSLLNCEFNEEESDCLSNLEGSNWRHSIIPTGNIHTGIRSLKNGDFVYAKGGNVEETSSEEKSEEQMNITKITSQKEDIDDLKLQLFFESKDASIHLEKNVARLHFGDFELPRQLILQFCLYMASENSKLVIESELRGYCKSRLVEFGQISNQPHQWYCYHLILQAGHYNLLDFVALEMPTNYSYIGLDSFKLFELDSQTCACPDRCSKMETQSQVLNSTSSSINGCQQSINTTAMTPTLNENKEFFPKSSTIQEDPIFEDQIEENLLPEIRNLENVEENQLPASFPIQKDNSYAPLAVPLPLIAENYIKFGGLDDDLQPLNLDEELSKLPKKKRRVAKF